MSREIKLHKMRTSLEDVVRYSLQDGGEDISMNDLIGSEVHFKFTGKTQCMSCDKFVTKLFAQGFCYDCFFEIPQAADWVIRPELSKAHLVMNCK